MAPFLDYTVHIPWGVDHQIFNPRLQKRENKAMVRDWLGIPRDALIFGFSGRIVPVKNIEAIIDAFAALTEKYPEKNIYFAVFGGNREDFTDENSYSYSLLNRIQKKNINELSEKIKFFGVYFPQTIMSAIDILVQPSFYESWGLAVTEAMACGIPVIVSDNPIMKEVTKNGQRYIDPSDASSLERAMEEFLLSPDLRQELGNNAYEDTLDYNWSNSFLTLIEHIRKFGLS
ncbi:hypothetical protein A2W14_01340 [Candidatus Gottesmanbacteria bacterium RBG_16_37_8]|uniref:Glycosyl transferase family 1 domain-containing protein n=1 Tax=Candidatus Gottesmanbacteria bacterium RBG_16_37_8 TaxID=1798371 RepID=A0A1F5YQE0_9BACT|nr:MAG: hypothetical protein A2W14_01340 [Candidatus Gottesmanbacteria bacterium RBG_16_37_8]